MLYHSMGEIVSIAVRLGGAAAVPFGSTLVHLVSGPLRAALAMWSRKSELSADRAAAAYLGSSDAITRVMFRFAGVRKDSRYAYDVDLFGAQALEFEALRDSRWDRLLQWQVGQASTHPLLAMRVREIQNWAGSPAFARLAALAEGIRTAPRCVACGLRVELQWRHCQTCGAKCELDSAASDTRTE
jgi:Zn-dependent protease with chaperone function